jgi:hypothetical protein
MPPTYAHIEMLSLEAMTRDRTDRAVHMPLLGLVSGLTLAVVLWTAIGWVAWAVLG